MTLLGALLVAVPTGLLVYAYGVYPAVLWLAARARPGYRRPEGDPGRWPSVSVSLPAYNEEAVIRGAVEALLASEYPADRLQVVVVSDASTDRTDEIVREFADRGVELLRVEGRGGKTAAENAAIPRLRGEIVVNTDASIRFFPHTIRELVRPFQDPSVGVASGRDVSVATADARGANVGETGYVDYEMRVRGLETRTGGIVGASGCCYAIRAGLHRKPVPESLSRDFAAALTAREAGYRAVSVDDAPCRVPRAGSLRVEMRRKARTMARGLDTLWWKRALMNPRRHGGFALKLLSHKLARWLVYLTLPLAVVGALLVGIFAWPWLLPLVVAGLLAGGAALAWPEGRRLPSPLALAGYAAGAAVAGVVAWTRALRGERAAVWEPTRRGPGGA